MVNCGYGYVVSMEKRSPLLRILGFRLVVFSHVMRDDGKIFSQLSVSLKRFFKLGSIRGTFEA